MGVHLLLPLIVLLLVVVMRVGVGKGWIARFVCLDEEQGAGRGRRR